MSNQPANNSPAKYQVKKNSYKILPIYIGSFIFRLSDDLITETGLRRDGGLSRENAPGKARSHHAYIEAKLTFDIVFRRKYNDDCLFCGEMQ